MQTPEVQSLLSAHSPPAGAAAHAPLWQTREQQSSEVAQVEVTGRHAQAPLSHDCVQQSPGEAQAAPEGAQTHVPAAQVPMQQSLPLAQPSPGFPQVQAPFASQAPEQQELSWSSSGMLPVRMQQWPAPHTSGGSVVAGSQSPGPLHGLPTPDPQLPPTLLAKAPPQQSLAAVTWSAAVPTSAHPHAPSTQRPEQQVWSSLQGAPRDAQVHFPAGEQPPKQQSPSRAQVTPNGLQVQAPAVSTRLEQQKVLLSGGTTVPGGAQTHSSPMQLPEPHWAPLEHTAPLSKANTHHAPSQNCAPFSWHAVLLTAHGRAPGQVHGDAPRQTWLSAQNPLQHSSLLVQVWS